MHSSSWRAVLNYIYIYIIYYYIMIDQKAIETVSDLKCVGVILDSRLKCDVHVRGFVKPSEQTWIAFIWADRIYHLKQLSYILMQWSSHIQCQVSQPVRSLYKQTLKKKYALCFLLEHQWMLKPFVIVVYYWVPQLSSVWKDGSQNRILEKSSNMQNMPENQRI